MKRRCMCCGPCIGRVESSSRSKGGLCKGGIAEALTSWQIMKPASAQAGNRASKMARCAQWRDPELERSAWSPRHSQQSARLLVAFLEFHLVNLGDDMWQSANSIVRWRPYRDQSTGSLPNSEVNCRRARSVLGWGTAWEALRVLLAFWPNLTPSQPSKTTTTAFES